MAKFKRCDVCGNLVGVIQESGVPMMCCGKPMTELVPNTVDASGEKHLPAVHVEDGSIFVRIGSVEHPMVPEHFIEWVYLKTDKGGRRVNLQPGEKPEVTFCLCDEKAEAVYAYCNLHGLWMTAL